MPTVLIVSASPQDQDRLRLSAEFRDIRHALTRSRNREKWTIESNEAITVDDLRRALLDYQPTVVHFSGHGSGHGGLCFEDTDGNTNFTTAESLAKLFHHFKSSLKCVVLNACYSEVQGRVINKEIDYVIGMNASVEDQSASKFAVALYDAIFAGTDFRTAFDLGCTALDLNNLPDSNAPVFMTGARLKASELHYSADIPEIEQVLYSYFNTPFDERWKFTTKGEALRKTMRKYYGQTMHHQRSSVRVRSVKQIANEHWIVDIGNDDLYYIHVKYRNVLIEWEASVGLWSIPVKTYRALGSHEPVIARVKAELADYYNYDFLDQRHRFQSVSLEPASGPTLHGFVERHSTTYKDLMDIISDGNEHAITLEIRQVTKQTDMPLISKVLSSSWLYHQSQDAYPIQYQP